MEALKQVTDRSSPTRKRRNRLCVSLPTPNKWLKRYSLQETERNEPPSQVKKIQRLKTELKRISEEYDIQE